MIVSLSGPSGIGKGFLKQMLKGYFPNSSELVWYTTRPLRKGEGPGTNRDHLSLEEFEKLNEAGEMIFVQNVYGNYYGVKLSDLFASTDGIVFTEFHPNIVEDVFNVLIDASMDFYMIGMTTDQKGFIRHRLADVRRTETPEEIDKRVEEAENEIKQIEKNRKYFDRLIMINDRNELNIEVYVKEIIEDIISNANELVVVDQDAKNLEFNTVAKFSISTEDMKKGDDNAKKSMDAMFPLRTHVNKLHLRYPLLLASGHITETPDFYLNSPECAGIVTRSLKYIVPDERRQTPSPRYAVFDDGHSMLNCEWGNTHPWREWKESGVDAVIEHGGAMIVALSGRAVDGCAKLIREFESKEVDAYEINVSCSHSGALHGNLNVDIEHLRILLETIRPLTSRQIWVKLSYSDCLYNMAIMAERCGANAIVCTNSIGPGMFIDIETGMPKLGSIDGVGGVTGRAIFPIALRCVFKLAETVRIPIIGVGGINTAEDAIQMFMAGASALQLYTAPALLGGEVFKEINDGIRDFLKRNNYDSLEDIRGIAHHRRV